MACLSSSSFIFIWVSLLLFFNLTFGSLSLPFSPAKNVTLFGDASFTGNAISLTQETPCLSPPSAIASRVGRALYAYPIRFTAPTSNSTAADAASFSCRFSFSITTSSSCSSGDGIAFLITSSADSFSFSDGFMGLPGPPSSSQDSFIAVEFDTNFDASLGDINDNHVGVDLNTVMSYASVDAGPHGIDLKSGRQINAWIEYRDVIKLIRVWIAYSKIRPPSPVLVAQIDLSKQFKEYMHVGFSASNGEGSALHTVDHWQFRTFESIPINSIDVIEEGDCFMCPPDDSTKNSNPFENHLKKIKIGDLALEFGGLAAFSVFLLAVIGFFVVKRKKCFNSQKEGQACRLQANRVPMRLSLAEIKSATMGFHKNRIVGEGGSATVYKGSLPSGSSVAVKRFDRVNKIESARNPFTTEFATMVGCLRHKNLVQLQGWCCEGSELVLVYEYLPNGSLDKILHKNPESSSFVLSWEQRVNIVLGVALALSYLHEECERQIIHRDVKSCNIMLDADFNPKLGDFGLAEVYEHSCLVREATIPAGTMGYLAPEYVYSGVPTVKTDVYSFGVVVIEVATGKRPVDEMGTSVVDWLWSQWENGSLIGAADLRLRRRFDVSEMERMLIVGLLCTNPNHEHRPTVKEAARILKGEAPIPLLPARKPTVRIRSVSAEDCEDILNLDGDHSPGFDDMPWLTPRSHFS